jgi:hypothetical protein
MRPVTKALEDDNKDALRTYIITLGWKSFPRVTDTGYPKYVAPQNNGKLRYQRRKKKS